LCLRQIIFLLVFEEAVEVNDLNIIENTERLEMKNKRMIFLKLLRHYTFIFSVNNYIIISVFILLAPKLNAQCITESELIYATDCNVVELKTFLYENNWTDYSYEDSSYVQFGEINIPVKELKWSQYDQEVKVLIPHRNPEMRIIAYYPSTYCFSNLYREVEEQTYITTSYNSAEIQTYDRNTVQIQLITDFTYDGRTVLAYQRKEVDALLLEERLVLAARKKEEEELKQRIKDFIKSAQAHVDNGEWNKALDHLSANEDFLKIDSIDVLYQQILGDFNSSSIREFQVLADQDEYEGAIDFGSKILSSIYIYPATKVKLTEEIKTLKETVKFLKLRPTRVYDILGFGIKEEIEQDIERKIQNFVSSSPDGGKLSVQVDWKSNYLGENNSVVSVNDPRLESEIKTELLKKELPKIDKYFVNSEATFEYNVEWDSRLVTCKNDKSIEFSRTYGKEESYITSWLQSKGKGKYTFKVSRIKINDREIFQVVFENYVNTNITPSVAKGYILPGSGKPSLTQGTINQSPQDTYARNLFWLSTLSALTCEGLSQVIYKSYLSDPTDITAYEDANTLHQYSLISAGAAVVCYVAGIVEAGKEAKAQRAQEKSFNNANKNVTIYQDKWSF